MILDAITKSNPKFAEIDLHPDVVPNAEMGDLFEELIRKFAEASNEEAGEHFTPRDAIRLMVELTASNAFGLVHLSTLTDDHYRINDRGNLLRGSRTGRTFMAGGTIQVTVDRVDRYKRQVDFRLADPGPPRAGGAERRRGQR